ncbi:MAG: MBL fold metallo-hydrolase [Planctomycetaceae bacterium]
MRIQFCGAAGEVTGSQHLIECGRLRILLDCGLFQGHRAESRRKNERFLHDPKNLDAVILSHAHIDHCGNLPGLHRAGFRGPVFCTDPTADVADIMLDDCLHIQQEDARHLNKRLPPNAPQIEPLYEERHVVGIVRQFEPRKYGEWYEPFPELRFRFRDAGHIIGSAICELEIQEKGETRRLVFTGDLGRRELPLLRDPELVNGCDILISESTYGNRVHPPAADLKDDLLRIILRAVHKRGKVIIPAFSLGRTQQLVYFLNEMTNRGDLPPIHVFVDSPLSNRLTAVYRRHASIFDEHVQKTLLDDTDAFAFHGLTYISTPQESMELNYREGPLVVIAASGMCESGRVLHHLKHGVSDPDNTIVIIGFQAEGTLGRRIKERRQFVRIFDREYPLKASVEVLEGLSAHADLNDFKWWYEHMGRTTGIGQGFLVHGEPEVRQALAGVLKDYCDLDPILPEFGQKFEV